MSYLEIMIIVINFNDADLLYYLLFDAFAQRRQVWCTMVAVERRRPPPSCLLAPSCLIFPSVCVCFCFHVARGLKAFFSAGSEGGRPTLGRELFLYLTLRTMSRPRVRRWTKSKKCAASGG